LRIKIDEGIHLNVVPSKQFKTTSISFQFMEPLRREAVGARTLLTSLLETSSADYPEANLLAAKLEDMYGASFGIGVSRAGRVHRVGANIRVLADSYTDRPLLPEALNFMRAVLLRPKLTDGQFDAETFTRERDNLHTYLDSMTDDRGTQASLGLQRAYFDDAAQALPSFGTAADLEQITQAEMLSVYERMINSNPIEIIVLGDVDPDACVDLVRMMGLKPRPELDTGVVYDQEVHGGVRVLQESANVQQSKLNLAYHVASDEFGPRYYANAVASELFGGSPLSLLFRNVREKNSMAYYASSSLNLNRHLMMVQTGIDAANKQRVEELIAEQLAAVAAGRFDDGQFADVKAGMISDRRAALDSPQYLSDTALTAALFPESGLTPAAELEHINAVTRADVEEAAAHMQLQAVYFLKGEAK
jgi:predicted Zn-dependent peptidase